MSVRMLGRVFKESKHGGTELLMLIAIANFADDHGNAYPSVSTLATYCRMTPRNANLLLASLRASGELEVRQNEGPHGTNRYRIVLPLKPASSITPEAGFTPEVPFTLKPASRTPEAGFPEPLKPASDEPSLNRQEPERARAARVAHSSKKPRRAARTVLPAGFAVSPSVQVWAAAKGFGDLDAHLETFADKCTAKGYVYADWDAAFKAAIRDDWAGLRKAEVGRLISGYAARQPMLTADEQLMPEAR